MTKCVFTTCGHNAEQKTIGLHHSKKQAKKNPNLPNKECVATLTIYLCNKCYDGVKNMIEKHDDTIFEYIK